ncbi:hypothetical protein SLEP1_g23122 [Rubroshorea leprosula]|uniref:Fanconi Anaemia group E protein C-terminal domain-containing protein n=1 Tax=Rubroshorea leprosula TaxID=152421 RepID=A0AAV5JLS3_9ROSI|nr:hypothetical protein SLEP1_g23122 [Rubroshorea leprosula]
MESWLPLFDIFMNNPTPETEASLWLQRSNNATPSPSSTTTTAAAAAAPVTTSAFLSLLTQPRNAIVKDPSLSSPPTTTRVMFMQTLPDFVQSRILSFLACEHKMFSKRELSKLARNILSGSANQEVDFWVKRAAQNLFDAVSESSYEWTSGLDLGFGEERVGEEFDALPDWLKEATRASDPLLSWLPLSQVELNSRMSADALENNDDLLSQAEENSEDDLKAVTMEIEINHPSNVPHVLEIQQMATSLKARIMNIESTSEIIAVSNEIRELCVNKGVDSLQVLSLIEPWKVDDETASLLICHLSSGNEEEFGWPSQVLCAIVLPKFLILEEPASRVLVTVTIEYCKLHQRAAVYGLLFPLLFRKDGINNCICDVITRIVRECLHPAHVSAFCQKLLCGDEEEKRFILLPCHQCLISVDLVWTESLFVLFQNILNHNVQLTRDSVDHLVYRIRQLAERFCKSLKFGNFLLCLVNKCAPLLKSHKSSLIEAVDCTNTIVTKSMLSKLASL